MLAQVAQCTGDRFWSFWELLAKNPGRDDELSLRQLASFAGLSESALTDCLQGTQSKEWVEADISAALESGIESAGRIVVEGRPLPLGINAIVLDATIRASLGDVGPDIEGRVPGRRLAPVPTKGLTGTTDMVKVGSFFMDAVEASVTQEGAARSVAGMAPSNANWEQAFEACTAAGKRLCSVEEYTQACSGRQESDWLIEGRRWPHSDMWAPTVCWDSGDVRRSVPYETGQKAYCRTPEGVYDLTGNVWEWVGTSRESAQLVGGSFLDGESATCGARLSSAVFGPLYSSPWVGFRCCAEDSVASTLSGLELDRESPDFVRPDAFPEGRTIAMVVSDGCRSCPGLALALARLQTQNPSLSVVTFVAGLQQVEAEALMGSSPLTSSVFGDPEGDYAGQLQVISIPTVIVLNADNQVLGRAEGYSAQSWQQLLLAIQD